MEKVTMYELAIEYGDKNLWLRGPDEGMGEQSVIISSDQVPIVIEALRKFHTESFKEQE